MKKQEELVVITKTYDLILWSCNHTGRFPRQHRFILGERLERTLYDLLETLIRAKYSRDRNDLLKAANLKLEILRFQMRLAKDLQCLQVKSYGFAAKQIDESARASTTISNALAAKVMWLKVVSFRRLTGCNNKPCNTRRSDRESQGFRRRNVGAEGYALGIKVLGAILAFLYLSAVP